MSKFEIGQRVVCIDDKWTTAGGRLPFNTPKQGAIYTIAYIEPGLWEPNETFLGLAEVPSPYHTTYWEECFEALPKRDTTTQVEALKKLCEPVKERELV